MLPLPLIAKIVAIKNAVAFTVISPVARRLVIHGQNYPGFQTLCRGLTRGYHTGRQGLSRQIGRPWTPPSEVTRQMELEIGSKFMAWGLLTGTITTSMILYDRRRRRKKEEKIAAQMGCPYELPKKYSQKK